MSKALNKLFIETLHRYIFEEDVSCYPKVQLYFGTLNITFLDVELLKNPFENLN
jgi:hypothetical protein